MNVHLSWQYSLHLLLVWNGDILTEYALAWFLVLPLLLLRPQGLFVAALSLLAVYAAGPLFYLLPWPDTASLQAHVVSANQVYSNGGFADVRIFSVQELPLLLPLHMYVFPRTLAL